MYHTGLCLVSCYINDAGEGGLRQWVHFGKPAPSPAPLPPGKKGGRTTRKTKLSGYILILQDDGCKVTFLNCLTGDSLRLELRKDHGIQGRVARCCVEDEKVCMATSCGWRIRRRFERSECASRGTIALMPSTY